MGESLVIRRESETVSRGFSRNEGRLPLSELGCGVREHEIVNEICWLRFARKVFSKFILVRREKGAGFKKEAGVRTKEKPATSTYLDTDVKMHLCIENYSMCRGVCTQNV